jgi:hypothetical protein
MCASPSFLPFYLHPPCSVRPLHFPLLGLSVALGLWPHFSLFPFLLVHFSASPFFGNPLCTRISFFLSHPSLLLEHFFSKIFKHLVDES